MTTRAELAEVTEIVEAPEQKSLTEAARRAIVAVPIGIANQIRYEPMLPVDRMFLQQRMPSGAIFKINVVYDEPFWRADGLSGQSAAPGTPAPVTIEACTDKDRPGVMCVITEGPIARELCRLDDSERRTAILGELVKRFGGRPPPPSTTSNRIGLSSGTPAAA